MATLIPIHHLNTPNGVLAVEELLRELRLDLRELLPGGGLAKHAQAVEQVLVDVGRRGDEALVANARAFDDPEFSIDQIAVTQIEMEEAAARVPKNQMSAIRKSIAQVRDYQEHMMPTPPAPLHRGGVELAMRFVPLASAGLYFPGGKASYPSTLIMLAVPAQVAGVKRLAVCTPASRFGRSDLVLATCHELKLTEVFRAGGAAAIGALAFGTDTIKSVDKIVGPGNIYVQLAKRALSGVVGIDGFLGPSEIVVIADETGRADFIAADLLAQAEHDPGSCFLITDSLKLADAVLSEMEQQIGDLTRRSAIETALSDHSAIIVVDSMDQAIELADRFAAEHVSLQTRDNVWVVARLQNAGAVFVGPWSPVAAGDYVAGPSHCLPTNTTARFTSGISVYEFLKRASVETYDKAGLNADADAIIDLAEAEQLDAHAQSVRRRFSS